MNTIQSPRTRSGSDLRWVQDRPGLCLEVEGDRCVLDARIRRVFPLSAPDSLFSILDGENKEVALLSELDTADEATRERLRQELSRAYATTAVLRIDTLKQDAGMWRFSVDTSRGPTDFFVRGWRDNSFEIGLNRWMMFSVDGVRYEIPDITRLDERSRKLLDQLL